jgi:hypothetical protein
MRPSGHILLGNKFFFAARTVLQRLSPGNWHAHAFALLYHRLQFETSNDGGQVWTVGACPPCEQADV